MKLLSIFIITITILSISCKKDDNTLQNDNTVTTAKKPIAEFGTDTTIVILSNYDTDVYFTDKSINKPTSWYWNFGDGSVSYYKNVHHTYEQEGIYTVTLIVSNLEGVDTIIKPNLITVKATKYEEGSFIDNRDGKQYKTIKLFGQEWMAENLAYKVDTGGCWAYNNDENNATIYGYLYTWNVAKNVSPDGWHLPTKEEWSNLIDSLNFNANKIASTLYWNHSYGGLQPTNITGFSALPAGCRYTTGEFNFINNRTFWWTSNESFNYNAWVYSIKYEEYYLITNVYNKTEAFSIRCIKNTK